VLAAGVQHRRRSSLPLVDGLCTLWPTGETPPEGDIVAIVVSGLDEKDAILFASPPGFFTISHFNGYPAVLVALAAARAVDVIAVLERMRLHLLALPAKRARTPTKTTPTKTTPTKKMPTKK
jgi:hypothetical protein